MERDFKRGCCSREKNSENGDAYHLSNKMKTRGMQTTLLTEQFQVVRERARGVFLSGYVMTYVFKIMNIFTEVPGNLSFIRTLNKVLLKIRVQIHTLSNEF